MLDDALALGRGLVERRAIVRWMPVTRQVGDALETPDLVLTIPGVERHWGRVEYVAAAICTIGDALERSEEHTSELQSRPHLVCRLLLEKKKSHRVSSRPV